MSDFETHHMVWGASSPKATLLVAVPLPIANQHAVVALGKRTPEHLKCCYWLGYSVALSREPQIMPDADLQGGESRAVDVTACPFTS